MKFSATKRLLIYKNTCKLYLQIAFPSYNKPFPSYEENSKERMAL